MASKAADRTSRDREALLRAVCDRPDADAPRLRYAKCLEATGDRNDALRAEYIRVQCELKRSGLSGKWWAELHEREAALDPYCEQWADELPKLDGVRWFDFS